LKRNLFGGLVVAGALTLWTGVAGFAATDAEKAANDAIASINGPTGCATKALSDLTKLGSTKLSDPDAQADLTELLADATADVNDFAKSGIADIRGTLADFQEELQEAADENEPAPSPSLQDFTKEVNDIATDTCAKIDRLMADVKAQVAELTAGNSKDEKDDQAKAAEDRHADAEKGERESEHGAELERD